MTAFWGASEAWLLFHELGLDSIKVVALYSFLNKIGNFATLAAIRGASSRVSA